MKLEKTRKHRNQRRDARTETERKLEVGGQLGLTWPLELKEKFIFILFFVSVVIEPSFRQLKSIPNQLFYFYFYFLIG